MKHLEGWNSGHIKYKLKKQFCHIGDDIVLNKKDVVLLVEVNRTFTVESKIPDLLQLTILKAKEES